MLELLAKGSQGQGNPAGVIVIVIVVFVIIGIFTPTNKD